MRALLSLVALTGLIALAATGASRPAGAQAASYTYFPSASTTDGRFMTLASSGLASLAGNKITMGFAAPTSVSQFEIGIFDGDSSSKWDRGTVPLTFTLYADPQGNGSNPADAPDPVVFSASGTTMPNNAWHTLNIVNSPAAQGPTGDYFYYLTATMPAGTGGSVYSSFKVRTTGSLIMEGQSLNLMAIMSPGTDDLHTIYPQYAATGKFTPTTYDGTWELYFDVPTDTRSFSIWEGDCDFGAGNGTSADSDDLDTPARGATDLTGGMMIAAGTPAWAAGTPARTEGLAIANPPDDTLTPAYLRSPSIGYGIDTPAGETFWNNNPSGDLEWEQFKISTNAFDRSVMDYHADSLPAGTYHMRIAGMDMMNLNAWRFLHDAMGVNAAGDPVKPIRPYWTVGDRVFLDSNGNGLDDREPGIGNVLLTLCDSFGNPVLDRNGVARTTRTDEGGLYRFNVVNTGTYTVKVDPATLPAGLRSSTGGNQRTGDVFRSYPQQSFLQFDFGYATGSAPAPSGQLGDRVWLDANHNARQDAGELGIAKVVVTLLDLKGAPVAATTTDAQGNYLFTALPAGFYTLEIDTATLPAGTEQTFDADGKSAYASTTVLTEGEVKLDQDFGYTTLGSIGDAVWYDADLNGVQDRGELGIPDVKVSLINEAGQTLATVTTDVNGQYRFNDLVSGSYTVTLSQVSKRLTTTVDLDGVSTPESAVVILTAGEQRTDVDFGFANTTDSFVTYSPVHWGLKPSGGNVGEYLHATYATAFPNGVVVSGGDFKLTFTSASAVTEFLPQSGSPAVLKSSGLNPTSSEAGELAGQVLALQLNLRYSDVGITRSGLGALRLGSGPFKDYTVSGFTALANQVLGGNLAGLPAGTNLKDLNDTVSTINKNFDNGSDNFGFLMKI